MKLKEFLEEYRIHPCELAYRCGVCPASIYSYLADRSRPRQSIAERIECETGGRVTVLELRGKDDRRKKYK